MAFGITAQGFSRKRLEDIKAEWEDTLRDRLGQNLNLLPESVFGVIVGIASEREASVWELIESTYLSHYPSTAEGVNLDRVAEITGAVRKSPIASTVEELKQILFGTVGTLIPIGSVVSVDGNPEALFETLAAVTLVAGADEIQEINYSADPVSGSFDWTFDGETITILASDNAAAIQVKLDNAFGAGKITASGTQTAAGGLVFTFIGDEPAGYGKRDVAVGVISSNSLQSSLPAAVALTIAVTDGIPQGAVNMQAQTAGPTVAPAGTLTEIETPISGWNGTVNQEDAVVGQDEEEDSDFRLRREAQVAQAGSCTLNAILADVLGVEDVTAAVVFQNVLSIEDADGRPPHSIDIVVQGGDEDTIAETIFETVGAGIETIGDIIKSVVDDQGFTQTIKFSRPAEVEIWVEIDATVDAETFPVNGSTQIRDAILAYAAELGVGQDVVVHGSLPSLEASMGSVPGIIDLVIRVGTSAGPTVDDNIELEPREIAEFDSSRITVTVL